MCPHLIHPNDSTMFVSADVVTQLRILGRHFPLPIVSFINALPYFPELKRLGIPLKIEKDRL